MSDNKSNLKYYPGFDISVNFEEMYYLYGVNVFGPNVEKRKLDSIRKSLLDQNCSGPENVYSIAMDVGKVEHKQDLHDRNLLYGTVIYSSGQLGIEPIRSQGHIHAISNSCGMSTPEVYEIWSGKAYIYMQENAKDSCGRCYAVFGSPGDIIIVPPGWAHSTISADTNEPLVFGAWCVRDYGFDYEDVREHKGLAYFPIISDSKIEWIQNTLYKPEKIVLKAPRVYEELNIVKGIPIYTQYEQNRCLFDFVTNPFKYSEIWDDFIP